MIGSIHFQRFRKKNESGNTLWAWLQTRPAIRPIGPIGPIFFSLRSEKNSMDWPTLKPTPTSGLVLISANSPIDFYKKQ